jgi:hypothetical protein
MLSCPARRDHSPYPRTGQVITVGLHDKQMENSLHKLRNILRSIDVGIRIPSKTMANPDAWYLYKQAQPPT